MPKTVTYNFKPEWAHLVESGHKPHTIRRRRKNPTESGDTLRLYVGQRTKACRLLREATCAAVTRLDIMETEGVLGVALDSGSLYYGAFFTLAHLADWDGFPSVDAFLTFFRDHYGIPTKDLELIEWRTPEHAPYARWQAPPAGGEE